VLTSPRRARAWTREILGEWHLADLTDTAETIVSELVANAAVHASTGPGRPVIHLALAFDHGELAILVSDHNPDVPQAQHPAEDDESGRGLLMVKALSVGFGWYPLEGGTAGKAVWSVLHTLAHLAATSPLASRLKAPAWPGNDQPGHRRGPLVAAGHAGLTAREGTRPVQDAATSPKLLRLAAAEAPGEDVHDRAPSPTVPPAPSAADVTAGSC